MIISIDTNKKNIKVDDEIISNDVERITLNDKTISLPLPTISSELALYRGTYEYEGIVEEIQKWYYGYVPHTAWCATTVSYFANRLGLLNQIGGKNDNVYHMMLGCKKATPHRFYERPYIPPIIKKDDILFMLWDGVIMNVNSDKHVCVAEYDSKGETFFGIGGNQKDKICTLKYNRDNIYALYRPDYSFQLGI